MIKCVKWVHDALCIHTRYYLVFLLPSLAGTVLVYNKCSTRAYYIAVVMVSLCLSISKWGQALCPNLWVRARVKQLRGLILSTDFSSHSDLGRCAWWRAFLFFSFFFFF